MNTSAYRLVAAICITMIFVLYSTSSFAGNYTWTGNSSKNWDNASNWSPSGVPTTNDTVTIGTGNDTLQINANTTINRLVISGRTLNLNGYELQVSQRASLNGGKIYNDTLKLRGVYAFFQGTNTNCTIDCIVNQIKFSGGTFDGTCSFEHNGSSNGWGEGGCVFNAPVTIKKSGSSALRLGQTNADAFNSTVEFICTSSGPIEVSQGSHSSFSNVVYLNCTHSSGSITFCAQSTSADLLEEGHLETGSTGISAGRLTIKGLIQDNTNVNELNGTGSALISFESCTLAGAVNVTSPSILLKNNVFNQECSFIKTSASSNSYNYGNNVFNGDVSIENQDASRAFRFANDAGDTFNANASFTTGSNNIQVGYKGNNYFAGDITINNNKVVFNASSGKIILTGANSQTLGGGAAYALSKLEINKDGGTVQLNRAMTIDSLITFTTGIINTDSVITLKAATACSGASNQSFVDGPVKKIGNTAFVFPVGDEGRVGSIEISAPAVNTESFTARYFERPAREVSDSIDTSLSIVSQCNYWSLNRNTGSTNVKVRLYWDTIGCALFDTTSIRVAEYTGNAWRSLGKTSLNGNSDIGNCQNFDNVTGFNYFTVGIMVTTQYVDMQLNSIDRPIQEDFFGFNGANTIERNICGAANQTWADIYSDNFTGTPHLRTLAYSPVNTIRFPAGTLSNYFDWRAGWYIREKHLPNNWLYDKPKYRIEPDYGGNELADFAQNLNLMAARPILVWNVLTSKLTYEIASTYRLGEVNLPLNYIELGNEFYLNDDQYKEVFPSVLDYLNKSREWIQDYRSIQIPQSTNVKFAVVGSDYGAEVPGRRKLWLKTLLDNISPSDGIDAVTVHDYIGTGLSDLTGNCLTVGSNQLKTYLNKAFKDGQTLRTNTFADIQAANQGHLSLEPLEIWLTEFNNLDDENSYIGTWPHGLFNAAMALQYLETPEVSKVITHTMLSDGVFGNIFESTAGFDNIACHGTLPIGSYTTRKGEFTALGNALNQIALALHNATNAKKIEFTPQAGSNIPSITPGSPYPVLYGWYFENTPGERQMIILNLDFNIAQQYNLTIPTGIFTGTVNYDQIFTNDFQQAILGNATSTGGPNEIQLLTNTSAGNSVSLSAGSITRIYQEQAPLQLKLTDNEICVGSTTSLVVSGGTGTVNISPITGLSIAQLDLGNSATSDHYWEITANNPATYNITVSDGVNSESIALIVHDDLTDLEILADGSPVPSTGTIPFCPGSTPLTLSASFTPGAGGSNSNSNLNDYHFIWAPDTGIISNTCSTGSFLPYCDEVDVNPERTTNYSVYVTDEHCWKSASVLVEVPISSVNLGPDFNACAGTNNLIVLEPIVEAESGLAINYSWSTSQTSSGITLSSLAAGANVYTVTVTATLSGVSCSVQESIQINGKNCCTGIANSVTALPVTFDNPETGLNEYYIFGDQLYTAVHSACSTCVVFSPQNSGLNNTRLEIDLSAPSSLQTILINQTLVLRNDILDAGGAVLLDGYNLTIRNANIFFGPEAKIILRQGRKLTLENCTLNVCGSEMWKGIEVEPIADDGEPHIILKNCVIMNAEQSILLSKNAQFEIENCTFTDNYIDIYIEKYSKKNLDQKFDPENDPFGMATQNFLRSNTFTSSGGYLLAPYNTVHKFAAIVLDDVERVVVGDSSLDGSLTANVFENSNFGIKSNKSSFELYNNFFRNITMLDGEILEIDGKGTCVYSNSASDFNDRSMIVGNKDYYLTTPAESHKNVFHSSVSGVVSRGEMNLKVFNNEFGSLDNTDYKIAHSCVGIFQNAGKTIDIGRENSFYDYSHGILLSGFTNQTEINISENSFYNGYLNTPFRNFDGTAIRLTNGLPILRMNNVIIADNEIGVWDEINSLYYQPRIGIHIANTGGVKIEENEIRFNLNAVPADLYRGIRLEGSPECVLSTNTIENTGTVSLIGNQLVGIRTDQSSMPIIKCNTLVSLGQSLQFVNNNDYVSLISNYLNGYDLGVQLGDGGVGTFIGDFQGAPGIGLDNLWMDSQNDRVEGFLSNFSPIPWYHHGSEIFSNTGAPVRSNNSYSSSILPKGNQLGYLDQPCGDVNSTERSAGFGSVAADTARYEGPYEEQFQYARKVAAFSYLTADTGRITMGRSDDLDFEKLMEVLYVSNIAKLDTVIKLAQKYAWLEAYEVLETISDTNNHEYYLKQVLSELISAELYERELTSSDSSVLFEIAHLHSMEGGLAVKIARAALQLELEDIGSGSRLYSTVEDKSLPEIMIWPNPVSSIINSNRHESFRYQIYDAEMRLVLSGEKMDGMINVEALANGYYSLVISDNKQKYKPLGFCKID